MSRGMVAAAAATGVLSLCGSPALADAQADGVAKNSSGDFSGNVVQVPVNAPVNACGNTVDAAAALNPSFGNKCGPDSDEREDHDSGYGADEDWGYGSDDGYGYGEDDSSGSAADSRTEGSSGTGSGNVVQVPVNAPVNACGNTVDVVGALNPVAGNSCGHGGYGDEATPSKPQPPDGHTPPPAAEEKSPPAGEEETPPSDGEESTPPAGEDSAPPAGEDSAPPADAGHGTPSLPETGSEGLLGAATAGAGLITGGVLLYRRSRAVSAR
ncbi:chaplin family protein [Streptomyces sp. HMX87]|uniref:chaplin n=1 Tax=Streptomyces sp. HMX87 TaxID=3390849 RepID=UPI003A896708